MPALKDAKFVLVKRGAMKQKWLRDIVQRKQFLVTPIRGHDSIMSKPLVKKFILVEITMEIFIFFFITSC